MIAAGIAAAAVVAVAGGCVWLAWLTLTHWGDGFTGPDEPARQATDEVTR